MYLKIIESKITTNDILKLVEIEAENDNQIVIKLKNLFKDLGIKLKCIEISVIPVKNKERIQCQLEGPDEVLDIAVLITKIMELEGIIKVSV